MEEWGRTFENCCEWRVGNGNDVLFWKDVWVGNEDLKSKFSRLYSSCGNKEGNLESCGEWVNDSWEWKLVWRRGLCLCLIGQIVRKSSCYKRCMERPRS